MLVYFSFQLIVWIDTIFTEEFESEEMSCMFFRNKTGVF